MNPSYVDNQFEDADEGTFDSEWLGGVAPPRDEHLQHHQLVVPAPAQQQSPNESPRDAVSVISSDTFHEVQVSGMMNVPFNTAHVTVCKSPVSDDSSVENDDMSAHQQQIPYHMPSMPNMPNSSHVGLNAGINMPFAMPAGVTVEDVLCGRGKGANNFIGNRRFRELVMNFRETYANSPRRADKRSICRQIIETIHVRGGRFLAKNELTETWIELDKSKILIKVSQALREGVAKWNKATQKHHEAKAKKVASLSPNPAMALLAEISSIRSSELTK